MPTQNKISNDAMVTVAGGAAMLGWLSYIAPILT